MPPKKSKAQVSKPDVDTKANQAPEESAAQPSVDDSKPVSKPKAPEESAPEAKSSNSKKRKLVTGTIEPRSKVPRRSTRSAPSQPTNPVVLLNYLLSGSSIALTRPKDEVEYQSSHPGAITYTGIPSTAFANLIAAVVLSRPISHVLGLRAIRTLLNEPYSFTTPSKLLEAGDDGRRKALEEAKTQHRQKTAMELGNLATAVIDGTIGDGGEDTAIEKVRKEADHDPNEERELITKSIKGLGKTGLDIFGRRVQATWKEWYPYIDLRTSNALEKLGLPGDAEELRQLLDDTWSQLKLEDLDGDDEEEKKRKTFVQVLERAIGADLEGNGDAIRKNAEEE